MECSICTETILPCDLKVTSCGHQYHRECLALWTSVHKSCPICRKDISKDPEIIEPQPEWYYPFCLENVELFFNTNTYDGKVLRSKSVV